jgi:hypothetical protein
LIDDASKSYTVTPGASGGNSNPVVVDGMKPTGSGTAEFNGKSLPYQEYTDPSGDKAQYFTDGDKLAGVRSATAGVNVDIVILELDQNVPDNVFDMPSGYTQTGS